MNNIDGNADEVSEIECSLCNCEFDLDAEGGICGHLGILPVALCPFCLSGLDDLFTQLHGCSDESL